MQVSTMPNFIPMDDAIKKLGEYWFVIIFIGTLVVGWTQFDGRISNNAKDIAALQAQVAGQNTTLVSLQTSIAQIQATLDFIKNNITR